MKRSHCRSVFFWGAVLIAWPATGSAEPSQRVFTTSSDNAIVEVDFGVAPPASRIVGEANGTQFRGLAVRPDGNAVKVFAGSSSQGGEVFLFDPDSGSTAGSVVASGFPGGVGGLTLDGVGNVFLTSAGGGETSVWTIPREEGVYGAPRLLVGAVDGAQLLADLRVVPYTGAVEFESGLQRTLSTGDLVVAVRRPGRVVQVSCDASACTQQVLASAALAGSEPTGIAFAPNGDLLVSLWEGRVVRLPRDGSGASEFAPGGTPGNAVGLAVGPFGGDVNVFVTTHNGGAVHRYSLGGQILQSGNEGLQGPNGVGSGAATVAAATPAGTAQVVRSSADEITFDVVTASGVTTMQAFVFPDPRGSDDVDLVLPGPVSGLPADMPQVTIPRFLRARPDHQGVPTFVMFRGGTTAEFLGSIQHHVFDHFGVEGACDDPLDSQPRLLYVQDSGGTVEDITIGCGSDLGRSWGFSWFFLGRDTRPVAETVVAKLDVLDTAAAGLGGKDGRAVQRSIRTARRQFERGRYDLAVGAIDDVIAALDPTAGTTEAEVVARAQSVRYFLLKLT